jgi:predicted DsbA family dithiol-disulfide isomerase
VPFFLEPDYPTDPSFEETNRVRLIRKWGGKAGWDAQKRRHGLKERGLEVGIPKFNLDRIASNTLASHRLVQWVTRTLGINAAETMYNSLNKLHFEDGQKLNNTAMLVEEAVAVGADAEEAREFLESEAGKPEIQAAQAKLRELGVSGIPTLILAGKWQMPSGAIGASSLVDAFRQLEEMGGGTGSMFAEALAIPDTVMEETLVL